MLQRVSKPSRNGNGHGHYGNPGHNSRGRALYRSYVFKDKDPVIDKVRTRVQDEGIEYNQLAIISGVSRTTLDNWFEGETKKPQYATIAAVMASMGYVTDFVKEKKVNYDREVKKAAEEIAATRKREERRLARAS